MTIASVRLQKSWKLCAAYELREKQKKKGGKTKQLEIKKEVEKKSIFTDATSWEKKPMIFKFTNVLFLSGVIILEVERVENAFNGLTRDGSAMVRRDCRNEILIINVERKWRRAFLDNYLIVQIYHLWMRSWVGKKVLKDSSRSFELKTVLKTVTVVMSKTSWFVHEERVW